MAQALQFQFGSKEFSCSVSKVDRTKLYGTVKVEAVDESGRPCELGSLAGDGKTLIPMGGTALAYLSPDGEWRDKGALRAVDLDGEEITPVSSTFKLSTQLSEKASFEEYLSHNIRLIYELSLAGENEFPSELLGELKSGVIYKFPFSYRGGLDPDSGFMLMGADEVVWMTVGKKAEIHFVGQEETRGLISEDEEGDEADGEDMDFGF
tara:strand:- start:564 stop:1187 length:624 start_codon:yes stop_codon:yes gene_type:complete